MGCTGIQYTSIIHRQCKISHYESVLYRKIRQLLSAERGCYLKDTQTHTYKILDNASYPILGVFQKIRLFLPAEETAISTAKDTQTDKDTHRHTHTEMTHRYIYTDAYTHRHKDNKTQTHKIYKVCKMVGWHAYWTHFHYFHFLLKSVTFLL